MGEQMPRTVYFFATCLVDMFYPNAGLAGMALIKREGLKVIYPRNQTCCGQPAYNAGYRDEARKVAAAQLDLFPGNHPIVVPSGSCAGMMKHHYPDLFFGKPEHAKAVDVADRVWELTGFLTDVLNIKLKDLGEPLRVALHTSCSTRREMGMAHAGESLLAQLDAVEVVEQTHKAECCGFGGSFAVKQPEISSAMVRDKTEALRATEASLVVSQDSGCLMNIGGAIEHQGEGPKTQHIAEFLWERTRER
ncbi:MAG: (Fe-S)-binding protein [Candidatus Thiodiazotropha sp. (ex Monitilora ramsayi)]|nr:(Fe-S)-binding protein [Candidatus Thiodiazotropha sp. (ex Monitilora ramsayi)]